MMKDENVEFTVTDNEGYTLTLVSHKDKKTVELIVSNEHYGHGVTLSFIETIELAEKLNEVIKTIK
jgi:hypothetical protein